MLRRTSRFVKSGPSGRLSDDTYYGQFRHNLTRRNIASTVSSIELS